MWASPGRRSELAHVCKSCVLCLDLKVERELILQMSLERRIPSGCRETFNSGIIVTRDLWHSSCYNDDEREPNPSSNRICREPIWAPPPMSAHVCAMSLNAAHAQLSQYASTFFIVSRTHHRKRRESIPITRRLTINSATLWIPYSPPKNSQKKAIQHSLSLTRLFSLSKAFLRLSTPRGRWYQRRDDGIEVCFILLYLFIYLFSLLDWKAVSRLCGRTASWQDLSHFTLHLPPALSLPHAERHSGRRSPSPSPSWSKRNKIRKATERDGRINMLIYMNYLFSPLRFTCCCFLPSIVHLLVFSIILPTFVSLTHSPTLSPLLMSRISIPPPSLLPPLPPSLSSPARCLWFTFEVFIPPAVPSLSSHPHTLTSSSRFSPSLSHFPLLSPHRFLFFPHCFSSLPLRLSDNCLRRRHFYRRKTNRTGGGCDTHPCHPVTPPSSRREESSHLFFCSSFLRSIISSIPVK